MKAFKVAILLMAITAVVLGAATNGAAQNYPTKPIHIIVGFGPGGVADMTCRIVANKLSAQLGQQILIENRPSAGGIVAASAVATSAPDGYNLLLLSNGNAVTSSLFKSVPYDPVEAFDPVAILGTFDLAMLAKADSPLKTVKDVLAYAKANPGKLTIGTINVGSTQNLSAELFKSLSGIDATIIPYKGSTDVVVALRSGDIQIAFDMLAPVISQYKSGALRINAITADHRFPSLPDVPTIAESGVAGYQASSWNAIAAPAKTPKAIIDKLNKEINIALNSPEVKAKLLDVGVVAREKNNTPEELKKLLVSETKKWAGVIEKAKIPKQ